MGVMREFNRDSLGFIERAQRDYGDVVWMRFLYVPALFLYHPNEIAYVLSTNPKNFRKSMSLRSYCNSTRRCSSASRVMCIPGSRNSSMP